MLKKLITAAIAPTVNSILEERDAGSAGWSVLKFYGFLGNVFMAGLAHKRINALQEELHKAKQNAEEFEAAKKELQELRADTDALAAHMGEVLEATAPLRYEHAGKKRREAELIKARKLVEEYEAAKNLVERATTVKG